MTTQQWQDLILLLLFFIVLFAVWLMFRHPDLLKAMITIKG